jgi:nucleoid-associated protein
MPIRHCIVHLIDKKPDGSPAVLHARDSELAASDAIENLLADLNDSYNAKQGKAWGLFHGESGAYPFSGWLKQYLEQARTSRLQPRRRRAPAEADGRVQPVHRRPRLFAHYQQGMTDYLAIALLHHSEGVAVTAELDVTPSRHLDLGQLHLAARINLSEWKNNQNSKQYISFIKGKNGKKVSDYFRDFIGCQEGVDGPGETRTLLKAFSDFVERKTCRKSPPGKDPDPGRLRHQQTKMGEPMGLEELSSLIDEDRPQAFYDHIRNSDYGLSPEIPADKRTLNQFRRFTGRAEGLSISFESHLLGSKIEYDEEAGTLVIKGCRRSWSISSSAARTEATGLAVGATVFVGAALVAGLHSSPGDFCCVVENWGRFATLSDRSAPRQGRSYSCRAIHVGARFGDLPGSRQHGGWHRPCRCSRVNPLPQISALWFRNRRQQAPPWPSCAASSPGAPGAALRLCPATAPRTPAPAPGWS